MPAPARVSLANYREPMAVAHVQPEMSVTCPHCGAHRFIIEALGICCKDGKVLLPMYPNLHNRVHGLFTAQNVEGRAFRKNVRRYNQCLSFTSLGFEGDVANGNARRPGVYNFRIRGQLHHLIGGGAVPQAGQQPKFAQILFYDAAEQVPLRNNAVGGDLDAVVLHDLIDVIETGPHARLFKQAKQVTTESDDFRIVFHANVDQRTHNEPRVSEVGAILINGAADQHSHPRDVVIQRHDNSVKRISELHPDYDQLTYVLLFPQGLPNRGWHPNLLQTGVNARPNKRVTLRMYSSYYLMRRAENLETNPVRLGGRLAQQFIVDSYARIESNDLEYIRANQDNLRADLYSNFVDAFNARLPDGVCIGRHVVLPATFVGSPRYMAKLFQDCMAIVRKLGKPHFFITMTCNPKWLEILRELLEGQTASDDPVIVARVFNLKVQEFIKATSNALGKRVGYMYTIEFQKRGLPHIHMLLWVSPDDCPTTVQQYDDCVSAEIPDAETQPELHELVTKHMIHGPCGVHNPNAPCMVNGRCSKNFPKPFQSHTTQNEDGFPAYMRRSPEDGGRTFTKRLPRGNEIVIDNRWVVPYNPYLLKRFGCHMNVELCSSVKAVSYIVKYIHKGPDMSSISVVNGEQVLDEVANFVNARYISPVEAAWKTLSFHMHGKSHDITHLPVHLPEQQQVLLPQGNIDAHRLERAATTMLTAYFDCCANDEAAREFTYHEFPEHYAWKQATKKWERRRRGHERTIGRVYTVSLREGERYYLRTLLSYVRGPTCFEDVRTVDGVVYDTFKEACVARGLLRDDNEWVRTMTETSLPFSPASLREYFATVLAFGNPVNPGALWTQFYEHLTHDIRFQHADFAEERIFAVAANHVNEVLRGFGMEWNLIPGLRRIPDEFLPINNLVLEEELAHPEEEVEAAANQVNELNREQLAAADRILEAVREPVASPSNLFFIHGPGGTGKTFLYNCIAGIVRSQIGIVLTVASSGIAALLLPGGKTAHSQFKIPINLLPNSTCNIPTNSPLAELIRRTKLIIWDEAPMCHRYAFEALDRTLRDVCDDARPMGGKIFVMGGDFRQILPVVLRGGRGATVAACIARSFLWEHTTMLPLTQNMRVNEDEAAFAQWLLEVGNGTAGGEVAIPQAMRPAENNLDSLISEVYPDFDQMCTRTDYVGERVILAPTNAIVDRVNEILTNRFRATLQDNRAFRTYESADSVEEEDINPANFPIEFLNSLTLSGMPPHRLALGVGMVVILLRNLNKRTGLCNGSRLMITRLLTFAVEAQVLTGSHRGETVLIPRIDTSSVSHTLPFTLKRRQLPLKPAYAMTINKAQGQTLRHVGVLLDSPVFTHGQLYVALSRVRDANSIKLVLPAGCVAARNTVYSEVFGGLHNGAVRG